MNQDPPIFAILSALLDYPEADLIAALAEARATLASHPALPDKTRLALCDLADHLAAQPLLEIQEEYVETFDRDPAASLYLFEHVHGESRERGQAMVDLLAMYGAGRLHLVTGELPDYLPVFLEFLSRETPQRARALLGEIAAINQALAARLAARGSRYAAVLDALLALTGLAPATGDAAEVECGVHGERDAAQVRDPEAVEESTMTDLQGAMGSAAHDLEQLAREALDRAWEEAPVDFGGPAPCAGSTPQPIKFYGNRSVR